MDYLDFSQIMKNIQKQISSDSFIRAVQSIALAQDTFKPVMNSMVEQYTKLISGSAFDSLRETFSKIGLILQKMAIEMAASLNTDTEHENIAEAIEQAMPYVSDEETSAQCSESIRQLRESPHFKLTFDRAIALLSLLISLFFGLANQLPEEQLDEIISNQQQARIESKEENDAIVSALYAVRDSIGAVSNEVEALRDELNDRDDSSSSQSDSDTTDSQDDDADSQN